MKKVLMILLLLFPLALLYSCDDSSNNSGSQGGTGNEPSNPDEEEVGGGSPKYEPKLFTNPSSHTGFYIDKNADLYITGRHFYEEPKPDTSDTQYAKYNTIYAYYNTFTKVKEVSNVKKAVGSANHILILTNDGDLYSWGYDKDEYGFLGHGDKYSILMPTKIIFPNNEKIKDISVMNSVQEGKNYSSYTKGSSIALTEDNKIYGWGNNASTQLGKELDELVDDKINIPVLMENRGELPDDVIIDKIASGENWTLALGNDGNIYGWGYNQAGSGTGCYLAWIDTDNDTRCRKRNKTASPVKAESINDVKDINVSLERTFVTDKDGHLYVMGRFASYPGFYTKTNTLKLSKKPTILTDENGNEYFNNPKFALNFNSTSLVIANDGKVYGWGSDSNAFMIGTMYRQPNSSGIITSLPMELTEEHWKDKDIKSIFFGYGFTYLTTTEGKYYSMGRFGWIRGDEGNQWVEYGGQLGIGEIDPEEYGLDIASYEMQEIIINK